MKLKLCFIALLLAFSGAALAQSGVEGPCPQGMHQTGSACDFDNAMNDSGSNSQPPQPQQPQQKWEDTWGAIAIGSGSDGASVMGAVTGLRSERQAGKAAVAECQAKGGGKNCNITIAYYNQCAVVAWGDTGNHVARAETVEIATEISMSGCSAKHANCSVYYSGCSPAKRVF